MPFQPALLLGVFLSYLLPAISSPVGAFRYVVSFARGAEQRGKPLLLVSTGRLPMRILSRPLRWFFPNSAEGALLTGLSGLAESNAGPSGALVVSHTHVWLLRIFCHRCWL